MKDQTEQSGTKADWLEEQGVMGRTHEQNERRINILNINITFLQLEYIRFKFTKPNLGFNFTTS